jgi:hypothetical protein
MRSNVDELLPDCTAPYPRTLISSSSVALSGLLRSVTDITKHSFRNLRMCWDMNKHAHTKCPESKMKLGTYRQKCNIDSMNICRWTGYVRQDNTVEGHSRRDNHTNLIRLKETERERSRIRKYRRTKPGWNSNGHELTDCRVIKYGRESKAKAASYVRIQVSSWTTPTPTITEGAQKRYNENTRGLCNEYYRVLDVRFKYDINGQVLAALWLLVACIDTVGPEPQHQAMKMWGEVEVTFQYF